MRHNVSIEARGAVAAGVTIDGVDVSRMIRAVSARVAVGDLPRVQLDMVLGSVAHTLDGAAVSVDHDTAQLLVRLGWTPPPEDAR